MYIDNSNLAYDLSRFDNTEREHREEKRKKEEQARKIRLADSASLAKSGTKFTAFVAIVALFMAFFSVTWFNAKKDDTIRQLSAQEELLNAEIEDNTLLQSKLDSKANISYIENYAKEKLKMNKVGPSQKKYISVNTESLIETQKDDSQGFLGEIKKGFKSFLEYIGF